MARNGRAIVVGAGIAGSAAAHRLRSGGYDVTLLESEAAVGGRTGTVEKDGFRIDTAATMLLSTYRRTSEVVTEIGLDDAFVPGSDLVGVTRDARVHRFRTTRPHQALASNLLSRRAKSALVRVVRDVLRRRRVLDWSDPALAADVDLGTARDYADGLGSAELRDQLVDPACRFLGLTSLEDVTGIDFLFLAANMGMCSFFNHPSGMSYLARILASTVDVRVDTEVLSVEDDGTEVRVTSRSPDGTDDVDTAQVCVLATPGPVTARIWVDVDPQRRAILAGVRYSPAVNVSVGLASAPPEPAALVLVPSGDDDDLACYGLDHNKAPGRAPDGMGLITTYWHRDWSEKQAGRADGDVVDEAVDRLRRFVPGIGDVVSSNVARWDNALVTGPRNRLDGLRRLRSLTPPSARVRLAGDAVSSSNVESSLNSGERAADELLAAHATAHLGRLAPVD